MKKRVLITGGARSAGARVFARGLEEALLSAAGHIDRAAGQAFDIGGGGDRAVALAAASAP
jgi:hypothetical protein